MGLVVTYFSPATPGVASWSEDLSSAVRLGTIAGLIDDAELGTVGISSLLFDDPDGTLGHNSDGLTGLKQLYVDETAAPVGNQRLWTGYIADRRYHRGTDSLITGVARKIDATLTDVNGFLSFRIFAPVALDSTSSFVRPAETDVQRVAALLLVDFLSTTLFDDGLVESTGGIAMNACDYTGQHPMDVLHDCAQASGRNFWAQYNEATGHYQLFYHFDYDAVYDSALQISNVLADVDNVTTFAPEPDAELVRDPSRIVSAVYMPFNGSNSPAYRTRPANACNYAWRDGSAPSANVKTITMANARADRYLADSVPEDDRITCTVKIPREYVTGIKAGHRVMAKFSHLPGMAGSNWCRVLNRSVMANEMTNTLYNVRYELSPVCQRFVLTTGLVPVSDRGDAGGPSTFMLPVTIPAGGRMTVVRYDWTGYSGAPDGYWITGLWVDSYGVMPPALGWAADTTLGADLGSRPSGGGSGQLFTGNGFTTDSSGGAVVYHAPYSYPLSDGALSGEVLRNSTSVPIVMHLRCGSNPEFGSVGTWSITTTVIVCPT